jgi:hypothetical protein
VLLVGAIALDMFAMAQLATALGVASDLYPRWLGARAWLVDGTNPYAPEIAERIRADMAAGLGWDGRADSGAFAFGFVYPGYVAILLAPLAILPFPVASTVWLLLAQAAIAGSTILLWRETPGAPSRAPVPEVIAVALAIIWPPAAFNLVFGQFATLVTFLLVLSITLARASHPVAAGIALVLAMVKPQLGLVPAVAGGLADLHAAWRRREASGHPPSGLIRSPDPHLGDTPSPYPVAVACASGGGQGEEEGEPPPPLRRARGHTAPGRFAGAALVTMGALISASLIALPGWLAPFLDGVTDYARAAKATSPAILVADGISRLATGDWPKTRDLPGTFETLPLAVGGAVSVAVVAGWRRQARRDPGVPSAITAGALAAAWLVPPTYEWNHVTCLLVLVPWVRRGGRGRAVSWLAASGATLPLVLAWPDGSRAVWPVMLLAVWLHDAATARAAPNP